MPENTPRRLTASNSTNVLWMWNGNVATTTAAPPSPAQMGGIPLPQTTGANRYGLAPGGVLITTSLLA